MQSNTLVVSDTGPLITLCQIKKLDVLHKLFNRVFIPKAVYNELNVSDYPHEIEAIHASDFIFVADVSDKTEVQNILESDSSLHIGEVEAIVLTEEISVDNKVLIIDDMKARSYAEARGINTVGAIGIIAQSIRRGFINPTEVEHCISTMKQSNRFYSESLYDVLRKVASEEHIQHAKPEIDDKSNEEILVKDFISHKSLTKDIKSQNSYR